MGNQKQEAIRKPDSSDLIIDTLTIIKEQIGLDLKPCDFFFGVNQSVNGQYFNVILNERTAESEEYTQLVKFALQYQTIKVEPNGLYRVAIFPLPLFIKEKKR